MINNNSLIICIFVMINCTTCEQQRTTTQPVIRSLTESVYSSATIQPKNRYDVYAAVGGILESLYIEEGDSVQKGDQLFQIRNTSPRLQAENARLALELARENYAGEAPVLQEIKQELAAAQLRLQNDSLLYTRQKALWEKSIGSKNEFEARKTAYNISQTTIENLQNRLSRTKKELDNRVQQAKNNYQYALVNTEDFTVYSLESGKVYEVYKEVGEIISQQQPVAMIGSGNQFVIQMQIDEVDIVKVKENQEVIITLDAYKHKTFLAKVVKIYPRKDELNQTFLVEAIFKTPPEVLYAGLSGEANIVIAKKEKALIVPYAYLIDEKYVQLKEEKKEVTIGLRNLEYVEIIEGLDTSSVIYLPEQL